MINFINSWTIQYTEFWVYSLPPQFLPDPSPFPYLPNFVSSYFPILKKKPSGPFVLPMYYSLVFECSLEGIQPTKGHTLKYNWFPSLRSYQLPVSPQLQVGLLTPLPSPSWDLSVLRFHILVYATRRAVSSYVQWPCWVWNCCFYVCIPLYTGSYSLSVPSSSVTPWALGDEGLI